MTIHCGKCGAELLGAVNRCWKCGQQVVSRADGVSAPPVRRPPVDGPLEIPPWEALAAVIVDDEPAASEATATEAAESRSRRGSPFALGAALRQARGLVRPNREPSSKKTAFPDRSGAPVAVERPSGPMDYLPSALAIAFAGGSFSTQDYPEIMLAVSVVGLAFALVAVVRRPGALSIIAVLVCFLATARGGYSTSVTVYERIYGQSPWANDDEFEPMPEPDPANDGRLR